MKKLCCIFIIVMVMPIVCMETDKAIYFKLSNGIAAIPESNLRFMETLYNHYHQHKARADVEGIVPLFANVSVQALKLVNNALTVGPYKFAEHYNTLSSDDRTLLIKASGKYADDGKTAMLNVSELTKQLNEMSCIKSDCKDDDGDYVKNYFREKLIYNKSSFFALSPKEYGESDNITLLAQDIHPGSLFLDCYHSHDQCLYTIPLRIGDMVHQTAGSCFITNTHECRVTDVRDKHCVLWVVNHNNSSFHQSTGIKHKGEIKGCCLSKTGTGIGYAVTYSERDMVFSTITTHKDGQSAIESVHVDIPNEGTIVDACFDHDSQQFFVATHESKDLNSVLRYWSMDGKVLNTYVWSFKEHAFIEKILVSCDALRLLFGVADQCMLHSYKRLDNGNWELVSSTELRDKFDKDFLSFYNYINEVRFIARGDSVFMYDFCNSLLRKDAEARDEKNKQSSDFLGNWMKAFTSQPEEASENYRVYSPEGQFLLSNSLKNKFGVRWVETALLDAVTHKKIFSVDTLHRNFAGVGFSHDGTKLIFLNRVCNSEKVELLNDKDKKGLQALEDIAFQHVGVTSLLKRLCMECKENGVVTLRADSPAYHMLCDWTHQSSVLRELLDQCLPFCVKKVGGQKK